MIRVFTIVSILVCYNMFSTTDANEEAHLNPCIRGYHVHNVI